MLPPKHTQVLSSPQPRQRTQYDHIILSCPSRMTHTDALDTLSEQMWLAIYLISGPLFFLGTSWEHVNTEILLRLESRNPSHLWLTRDLSSHTQPCVNPTAYFSNPKKKNTSFAIHVKHLVSLQPTLCASLPRSAASAKSHHSLLWVSNQHPPLLQPCFPIVPRCSTPESFSSRSFSHSPFMTSRQHQLLTSSSLRICSHLSLWKQPRKFKGSILSPPS